MKVSIHVPFKYLEHFRGINDFWVVDPTALWRFGMEHGKFYAQMANQGKEIWLDDGTAYGTELATCSAWETLFAGLVDTASKINATHIVCPDDPDDLLTSSSAYTVNKAKLWLKQHGVNLKVIGVWRGFKKDLDALQQVADVTVLPFTRPRHWYVTSTSAKKFHYGGFRTLDELAVATPMSLDTDAPIVAAIENKDLLDRQRRAVMPPMAYNVTLTKDQLTYAIRMADAIRNYKEFTKKSWVSLTNARH